MAFSKKELLAERARRNGASTTPAPTAPEQVPQGPSAAPTPSAEQVMDTFTAPQEQQASSPMHSARSVLRGATAGLSDTLGAAIATVPAAFGSGEGMGDVYDDIRGTLSAQQEENDSPTQQMLEGAGTVASVAALGLPAALRGGSALAHGVGSTVQKIGLRKAARAKAKARAAKPRMVQRNGEWVESVNPGRLSTIKEGAKEGAALDLAQTALGGDADLVAAGAGAVVGAGGATPLGAAKKFLGGTPMGRMASSRMVGKAIGSKYSPWAYTALHPATRRWFADLAGKANK